MMPIPSELVQKWQEVVNLLGDFVQVPAALVMKAEPPEIVVLVASESAANPYEPGERAPLHPGLYCETVMKNRQHLLVPNARMDPLWNHNPDLKLGMISYLGFPIAWPSGEIFGTICVLDVKENAYNEPIKRLMLQFRDVIEADLRISCNFDAQIAEQARARLEESERARCVVQSALEELRRTEEVLQANQRQLQEAVRLRDEFLSVASHELRTPIASLQLMVQSVTQGVVPPSPANMQRVFELIDRQSARLTRLVAELLEVSRIQSGRLKIEREQIDLVAVARDVAQRFEADLNHARCPLTLRAEQPVCGSWDRSKLEQIVTNVLANAIKFGAGKPIEIIIEKASGNTGRLIIIDHGIGISREDLPRIFERFARAVSTRMYGGLGLGLYIVRSIVDALGGTVSAESVLGSGSTFTVELPCAEPRAVCSRALDQNILEGPRP